MVLQLFKQCQMWDNFVFIFIFELNYLIAYIFLIIFIIFFLKLIILFHVSFIIEAKHKTDVPHEPLSE